MPGARSVDDPSWHVLLFTARYSSARTWLLVLLGSRRWAERTWFEKRRKVRNRGSCDSVYAAKDELMASPVEDSGRICSVRPLRRVHVVSPASRGGSLV